MKIIIHYTAKLCKFYVKNKLKYILKQHVHNQFHFLDTFLFIEKTINNEMTRVQVFKNSAFENRNDSSLSVFHYFNIFLQHVVNVITIFCILLILVKVIIKQMKSGLYGQYIYVDTFKSILYLLVSQECIQETNTKHAQSRALQYILQMKWCKYVVHTVFKVCLAVCRLLTFKSCKS